MDFLGSIREVSEISKMKTIEGNVISDESCEKFDKLMGDDNLKEAVQKQQDEFRLDSAEIEEKFNDLFEQGDFFEKRESDFKPKFIENAQEIDEKGQIYKKNGVILPNIEYIVNGNVYRTDENGNKVSCDSIPEYTEEGSRNMKEQKEAGGEERQEDDDGGHIIARIFGGAEGEENLVPMRRTINRGDYKRMENEIAKALQEDKKVSMHIDIKYNENSHRPSKIISEYTIDRKKTEYEFDNKKNSIELMDSVKDKISDEDYTRLKKTMEEMREDGCDVAITSIKVEHNENGNPEKITIGILEELTGTKRYKEYSPR